MADNSQADAGAGGDVFATDDIVAGPTGDAKWPFAKLAFGALDSATVVADSAGARVPVKIGEALPAGAANIGDVDVASVPAPLNVVGGGTEAAALRVTLANNSTGVVSVDDNGGSLTVDGPLTDAQLRATAVPVSGPLTDAQLRATAVPVTLPALPTPEPPVALNATASGDTTVIVAPGVSLSIRIRKASVHNRGTAPIVVALRDGTAGTIRWRAELAAEGGGSLIDFGAGWTLTANTLLAVNLAAVGDVDVNVTDHDEV